MKAYIITIILFVIIGSSPVVGQNAEMLIGQFTRDSLEKAPYADWYFEEYRSYAPDSIVMSKLKPKDGVELLVYLGTWCSDSRREVPRFLKILDMINFSPDLIKMVGLNREKTAPDYLENVWDIQYVPTFIVLKKGKEIGRIIETPILSLEEDLVEIID